MKLLCYCAIAFILVLAACSLESNGKEPLRYPIVPNNSNALNTQGYYYYNGKDDFSDTAQHLVVLYRNGVSYGDLNTSRYYRSANYLDSNAICSSSRKSVSLWGAYQILNNDTLQIQTWGVGFAQPALLHIYYGIILNDKSFRIFLRRYYRKDGTIYDQDLNELYQFRPLKVKPDSTNPYVPEKP